MEQATINRVLRQIVRDIEAGDLTAIEELIEDIEESRAIAFLSDMDEEENDADYVAREDAQEFEDFDPITKKAMEAHSSIIEILERNGDLDKLTGGHNV